MKIRPFKNRYDLTATACFAALFSSVLLCSTARAEKPIPIKIDAQFNDWADVPSYTDPEDDTHDCDGETVDYKFKHVKHPDVDLLEFKFTHDDEAIYAYFRAKGAIGRTIGPGRKQRTTRRNVRRGRRSNSGNALGRYYAILTIDLDENDETGYPVHEGGYYPTTPGYDVNAEVEWYGGAFNTGHYLNHGCLNEAEKTRAFREQSSGKYRKGNDGPYPAGFLRILPGTYDFYTQWVYHKNDTITFVRDKGPVVHGIVTGALSEDRHQCEVRFPMIGFLKDKDGKPNMAIGQKIDISFSLEASGELAPGKDWASDTADPINGYVLEPKG